MELRTLAEGLLVIENASASTCEASFSHAGVKICSMTIDAVDMRHVRLLLCMLSEKPFKSRWLFGSGGLYVTPKIRAKGDKYLAFEFKKEGVHKGVARVDFEEVVCKMGFSKSEESKVKSLLNIE